MFIVWYTVYTIHYIYFIIHIHGMAYINGIILDFKWIFSTCLSWWLCTLKTVERAQNKVLNCLIDTWQPTANNQQHLMENEKKNQQQVTNIIECM